MSCDKNDKTCRGKIVNQSGQAADTVPNPVWFSMCGRPTLKNSHKLAAALRASPPQTREQWLKVLQYTREMAAMGGWEQTQAYTEPVVEALAETAWTSAGDIPTAQAALGLAYNLPEPQKSEVVQAFRTSALRDNVMRAIRVSAKNFILDDSRLEPNNVVGVLWGLAMQPELSYGAIGRAVCGDDDEDTIVARRRTVAHIAEQLAEQGLLVVEDSGVTSQYTTTNRRKKDGSYVVRSGISTDRRVVAPLIEWTSDVEQELQDFQEAMFDTPTDETLKQRISSIRKRLRVLRALDGTREQFMQIRDDMDALWRDGIRVDMRRAVVDAFFLSGLGMSRDEKMLELLRLEERARRDDNTTYVPMLMQYFDWPANAATQRHLATIAQGDPQTRNCVPVVARQDGFVAGMKQRYTRAKEEVQTAQRTFSRWSTQRSPNLSSAAGPLIKMLQEVGGSTELRYSFPLSIRQQLTRRGYYMEHEVRRDENRIASLCAVIDRMDALYRADNLADTERFIKLGVLLMDYSQRRPPGSHAPHVSGLEPHFCKPGPRDEAWFGNLYSLIEPFEYVGEDAS